MSNCAAASASQASRSLTNRLGNLAPHIEVIRLICARFVTGKMPGTIGTRMPNALAAIAKAEEIGVVVEQLRDHDVRAGIDLALQIFEIASGLAAS